MSGEQKNTLHDNFIGWALLMGVLAVILWLIWHYNDVLIRDGIRWLRYGQMWLVSWFVGQEYTFTFNGQPVNWWQQFESVPQWDRAELAYPHMSFLVSLALWPLKPVIAALLFAGSMWCMFSGPGTQYRQKLGIETLMKRQMQNFPVIGPFVEFDPSTQPPRAPGSPVPAELPLFAEALGPEEWLAYNSIPVPDGEVDEKAAARVLKAQLIGRWRGWKALKPYQQVLLACFCLKASRKRKEADKLLGRLALCWSFKKGLRINGKLLKDARNILKDEKLSKVVLTNANRHAFVTTAMLRALATAREEGGVLAPAEFLWLRAVDRRLWYALNNLGRQAFHTEALGAMSHYRVEKMTQRPVPVPKLEDGLQTLREYMKSRRARPIPQLDYSNSKKRGIKKAK